MKFEPGSTLPERWFSNYWLWCLIAFAVVEVAIGIWFLEARAEHRRDISGPCLDECLPTWLDMIFAGFLLFVWPIVALVLAAFMRILFSGVKALRIHVSASRR